MIALISTLGITGTPVSDVTDNDPAKLFELFEAVKANKASVALDEDTGVLTASLSSKSVRAIRRAEKAERLAGIKTDIEAALEAKRPQKIGPIVNELAKSRNVTDDKAKQKFRGEVLEALRALREDGVVRTDNATNSNFHATHTLVAKPEPFPVPEPEPEASDEVVDDNDFADEGDAASV